MSSYFATQDAGQFVTADRARMHGVGVGACDYGDRSLGTVHLAQDTHGECPCGRGQMVEVVTAERVFEIVCTADLA